MKPKRIQRKRISGWRMPDNAVYVGRPTPWGNPFNWKDEAIGSRGAAARMYKEWLRSFPPGLAMYKQDRKFILQNLDLLRGKDLVCWCPIGEPCHADFLLKIANKPN